MALRVVQHDARDPRVAIRIERARTPRSIRTVRDAARRVACGLFLD
jgi:hypothetical protein